jgi:putative DNA primase/helicase
MVASIMRDNADDKPRPDLLDALSKRLVIAEELSAAQHLHPDQIKRLTGGSLISARGMRANSYYRRRPAFTPWLVTNETPTIEGADEALKRRILVVPFDVQIPRALEARNYLTRLLETSLEAILAWVVKGYEMYVERPDLAEIPVGAMKANLKFASELSDFHTFISDACDTGPDYSEGPSLLFVAYEHWCELKRVKERDRVSSTKFGRSLGSLGFDKDRAMIDGKQTWVRTGIRLTEKYRKIVGKVTGLENSNPV